MLDEISNSDLEFIEKVGSGGFGSVWKGQWMSKQKIVAIKILMDMDEKEVRDLRDTCIVLGTVLSTLYFPFMYFPYIIPHFIHYVEFKLGRGFTQIFNYF